MRRPHPTTIGIAVVSAAFVGVAFVAESRYTDEQVRIDRFRAYSEAQRAGYARRADEMRRVSNMVASRDRLRRRSLDERRMAVRRVADTLRTRIETAVAGTALVEAERLARNLRSLDPAAGDRYVRGVSQLLGERRREAEAAAESLAIRRRPEARPTVPDTVSVRPSPGSSAASPNDQRRIDVLLRLIAQAMERARWPRAEKLLEMLRSLDADAVGDYPSIIARERQFPRRWTRAPAMPTARQITGVAAVGTKLYVAGGFAGEGALATLQIYDLASERWSFGPLMLAARCYVAAAAIDDRLYVIGGSNRSHRLSSVEVFDPSTGVWSAAPDAPTARGFAMAQPIGGRLYVVGGSHTEFLADLEIFDPKTGIWSVGRPMPTARDAAASGVIDGELYIAGGWNGEYLDLLEIYNPATDTWRTGPPMPTARNGISGGAIGGRLYVIGGYDGDRRLSKLDIYDPLARRWRSGPPMATARTGLAATTIGYRLLAVGGYDGRVFFDALEIMEP